MKKSELLEMIETLQRRVSALEAAQSILKPAIFDPSINPPRCLACGGHHGVGLPCPYMLTTAIAGSPPGEFNNGAGS